jgi:hypothetical protein
MTTVRLADRAAMLAERPRRTAGCWDLAGASTEPGRGARRRAEGHREG